MQRMTRQLQRVGAVAAAAAATGLSVLVKTSLSSIDANAKLAKSLGTTVRSMQTMRLAATYSGVEVSQLESTVKDFTRRLSQAADRGGPVADALKRIGLSAKDLMALPLDERVAQVTDALRKYVPAAQRAAVAGAIFGEEGAIAALRLDPETIRRAAQETEEFGVALSDVDAAKVEAANDAMARISLAMRGLGNRIAVDIAPRIERVADAIAQAFKRGGGLDLAVRFLIDNMGRIASYAAAAAAIIGGRFAAAFALAAAKIVLAGNALVFLRGALIRTGFGAFVVLLGEAIHSFAVIAERVGSFGAALGVLKDVALEVVGRIKSGFSLLGEAISGIATGIQVAFAEAFATVLEGFASMTGTIARGVNRLFEGLGLDSPGLSGLGSQTAKELRETADYWAEAGPEFWASWRESFRDLAAPLETIEKLKGSVAATNEELDQGQAAASAFGNAVAEAGSKGAAGLGKVKTAAEEIKSSMGQAFKDLVRGAKSFGDALADVLDKLADMVLDSAFETIWKGGLGDAVGSLAGKILGSADGNVFRGGAPMTAFATGGVVSGPTVFPMRGGTGLMGEAGPEAIMPLQRVGGKLGVRATGGGGVVKV
ncbi:MAG: phage tail tape measure protein, partial [Alphaproteobacteria bacterium]